jgi:hypothetical protein
LTSQNDYLSRPGRLFFVLAVAALAAMAAAGSAGAKNSATHTRSARCEVGYRAASKVVRKNGKSRRVTVCVRSAAGASGAAEGPQAPAPTGAPPVEPVATPPVAVPPIETPPGTTPPVETPPGPTNTGPEVHAAIRQGFSQNPLLPDEVTWHYSASATQTVTANGVEQTESIPLPEGRLVFFVDGQLDCEIQAGGAIAGSACTVSLQQLGAHEVEAIFSGKTSSTATRTDYIPKYPTSTNLQVSVEPTAPENIDIGPNKYGFDQHAFEVGRLLISGSVTPGGYPTFDCEGQPSGCLNPEIGLKNHRGSVAVPLYAQHRLNSATGLEEWQVAFDAYSPTAREEGYFWQFPAESVGRQFFHAVSEANPALYEPSSITVPLDLNGGHYPFYRWMKSGEAGGPVAAVEGTMQRALIIGNYNKFDGTEAVLKFNGEFYGASGETEGCLYQPRVDGVSLTGLNEEAQSSASGFSTLGGFYGVSAGPHTLELWVKRSKGAGPGNCALHDGWFEAYEIVH